MKRILYLFFALSLFSLSCPADGKGKELKVLYWNIQNGMWSDQADNYDHFVAYVQSLDPDICIWCEAESRYLTDTAGGMDTNIPLSAEKGTPFRR